jgi:hypothetical protein
LRRLETASPSPPQCGGRNLIMTGKVIPNQSERFLSTPLSAENTDCLHLVDNWSVHHVRDFFFVFERMNTFSRSRMHEPCQSVTSRKKNVLGNTYIMTSSMSTSHIDSCTKRLKVFWAVNLWFILRCLCVP